MAVWLLLATYFASSISIKGERSVSKQSSPLAPSVSVGSKEDATIPQLQSNGHIQLHLPIQQLSALLQQQQAQKEGQKGSKPDPVFRVGLRLVPDEKEGNGLTEVRSHRHRHTHTHSTDTGQTTDDSGLVKAQFNIKSKTSNQNFHVSEFDTAALQALAHELAARATPPPLALPPPPPIVPLLVPVHLHTSLHPVHFVNAELIGPIVDADREQDPPHPKFTKIHLGDDLAITPSLLREANRVADEAADDHEYIRSAIQEEQCSPCS